MTDGRSRLEGRVAAILNARELVINVGAEHGVKEDMEFAVLAKRALVVKDPVTDEELDRIDVEKVRVAATEVRQKVAVCRTYRTTRIPGGPLAFGFNPLKGLTRPPRDVPETLCVGDSSFPQPLSQEDSYVKVGDEVVEVEDD